MPYKDPETRKAYNKEYLRRWQKENREKCKEYSRKWDAAHRKERAEAARRHLSDEDVRERRTRYAKEYAKKYQERLKAKAAVNNAVARKGLRQEPCEVCGCTPTHGHHDDYSKPLEVRWLCSSHHKRLHTGAL